RGIQFEDIVLVLVVLPFIEAFQRRFEGLCFLFILLNVLEGCWEDRSLWLLIHVGESSRRGKGLVDRWHCMTQAKILPEKGVPDFPRPRIQGMALQTSLHPNRTDLLPKMLLGIADNLLGYVVCQRVVRLIMDGDTRHGNAPLPAGHGAAAVGGDCADAHLR